MSTKHLPIFPTRIPTILVGDTRARDASTPPPLDRLDLQRWVFEHTGLFMPDTPLCPHHSSPLDYLCHAFFEQGGPSDGDAIVWAPRGGGKTQLGAVATLLDMLYKPAIQIRIIGGSLEQSQKMYAYLRTLVSRNFESQLARPPTRRTLEFKNESRVEILAQSQTAVRGQRVQKLRCDEVDLFSPEIWEAAQMTTRSPKSRGQTPARGSIEAFSTMHVPGGLMHQIVDRALAQNKKIFRWCAWDVINRCNAPESRCPSCSLFDGCQSRAHHAQGFLRVPDLKAIRQRISLDAWNRELCCARPRRENLVFATFDRAQHVRAISETHLAKRVCGVDFGYAGAFVCVWLSIERKGESFRIHVYDELVQTHKRLAENIAEIKTRCAPAWPAVLHVDPAGAAVSGQSGLSDIRVLKDAGFSVRSRGGAILPGLEAMQSLLAPALGSPRWTVDPKCTAVIAALENYAWDSAQSSSPLKDGVHDHVIDALRYATLGELQPPGKLIVRFY